MALYRFGIFMLVLSFNRLITIRPKLRESLIMLEKGLETLSVFYQDGVTGISAWTGTIGFAVLMMTSADYFFPSNLLIPMVR